MGTILKYIFYIALIIIIYLVGKGIFEGSINETTTVGQVVDDVKSGAADMAADVADTTKKAVEDTKSEMLPFRQNLQTKAPIIQHKENL